LEDAPPIETGDEHVETIRLVALLAWALFAAAALALLALRARGMVSARTFGGLAVALVVVDLFRAGMGWNPAIDVDVARQPDTGALRVLRAAAPERFAGVVPGFGDVPVTPNTAMDRDLYDARGYDFPIERRYSRFWKRYVAANVPYRPLTTLAAVHEPALRALSLLGVSSIVQDPADPQLGAPGLRLAYNRPDARVYANRRALPRVWIASEQRVVEDSERALRAVGDPGWDPRRVAVVEDRVPNLEGGSGGNARLVEYETERVVVDVVSRGHGLLLLSDLFYPGWKARVDGREVDVERADYLLRGVPIADGRHRVEFRYEPLSWRVGWILSLAALLGMVALVAVGLRARRLSW
jgi:hypothetical protein